MQLTVACSPLRDFIVISEIYSTLTLSLSLSHTHTHTCDTFYYYVYVSLWLRETSFRSDCGLYFIFFLFVRRKYIAFDLPASLRKYSMVNQVMQTASTMAIWGLSVGSPFSSTPWRAGIVLIVMPTVEMRINEMENRLTT